MEKIVITIEIVAYMLENEVDLLTAYEEKGILEEERLSAVEMSKILKDIGATLCNKK